MARKVVIAIKRCVSTDLGCFTEYVVQPKGDQWELPIITLIGASLPAEAVLEWLSEHNIDATKQDLIYCGSPLEGRLLYCLNSEINLNSKDGFEWRKTKFITNADSLELLELDDGVEKTYDPVLENEAGVDERELEKGLEANADVIADVVSDLKPGEVVEVTIDTPKEEKV